MPYAGSSAIYRNESCPLSAIIVLQQAPDNHLERLETKQALLPVYSGLTLHPWDQAFMDRALADLDNLLKKVPIYRLSCRPDQKAVEILKKEMEVNVNGE